MNTDFPEIDRLSKNFLKQISIQILINKNITPCRPTVHNMVNRSRIFYTWFPWHGES